MAVLNRNVQFDKQDNFNALNQVTSRYLNVNYVKFDAIGSP